MDRTEELRTFVAARGAALSRTAYLLTGHRQAAEDLVQETYVEMVRRWGRIDAANPEPYVRRIMYSRFVDGWRRRRIVELPTAELLDRSDLEVAQDGVAERVTLHEALGRLTDRQRAFVVLRYYEDLTEVQTAAALGVSTSTVKSQVRVALDRLRTLCPDLLLDDEVPEGVSE